MEAALAAGGLAPVVNGWTLTFHSFDYNLDHLGPGTVDPGNWLPAPAAPFRPLMRLYQPRAAVLDGTYTIPPITRAAD